MKLTLQQRAAVDHGGHAVITACPGSGKTRTIIAKVLQCIDKLVETPRKVACITYTNTAVHEIEKRIREHGTSAGEGCYEISTIHAFCLNNILGNYHWLTEAYREGYTVLPPDHDTYTQIVQEIGERYELNNYARQQFEMLNRRPDGKPISNSIPVDAALDFWAELERRGFIDFCNIVYYSYRILSDNPSISHNLSCRFAYILLDEFQDTSSLQVELLKLVHKVGYTTFFIVGDPEQSIYSFAGAERELMRIFGGTIGAQEFLLSGNFRATQPLVDRAEQLISRVPPMVSKCTRNTINPSVYYRHTADSFVAMTDYFLPFLEANSISYGNTAILAQNWYVLRPLGKMLREYGVPVVGPGARPYKRSYILGRIAEQVCAYLGSGAPDILHQAEKELFMIASELTGKPAFRVFSYQGMRVVHRLMRSGEVLRKAHEGAAKWLEAAAPVFEDILIEEGVLLSSHAGCFCESCTEMLTEMKGRHIDVANMPLDELGILADPRKNMKLITMHGAKGREFEAVAIICAHDGLVPFHNYYNPLKEAGLSEARRLFYVAMTRAERVLWIFSSNNSKKLHPTRFIREIGVT